MKLMAGLIISILIIVGFMLFWPSDNKSQSQTEFISAIKQTDPPAFQSSKNDDIERVALMKTEYEFLEKGRNILKRRLSRLKHEMWGVKFLPEAAKQINGIMLNAYRLIKNPKMLGAFSSVEAIQDENAKVNFAHKSLDVVDKMIEENKNINDS